MSLTLGELLQENILPDIEILTAPANYESIPVALTSTQTIYELPVENFVKKHELVFSSSIGTAEEEAAYRSFITLMHRSGASAIIMAVQRTEYRPSQELLAHAAALQMPLFLIPWEHRFLEIQMRITAKIRAADERIFAELQTTLFNLYFDGKPLKSAADTIADCLGLPVQIVNLNKKILAGSETRPTSQLPQEITVTLNENSVGYLKLFPSPERELPDTNTLGRYICFPLAMWFLHKSVEDLTISRLKNDFIWNLANERILSREEMAYQSRQLQLDLSLGYSCLLLELLQNLPEEDGKSHIYAQSSRQTLVQSLLKETANQMGLQLMFSFYSSQIILYLEHRKEMPNASEQFIETVTPMLESQFPGCRIFWGSSESAEGPVNFAALHKHAQQALSYALRSKKQRYRFSYHDTKEAQITSLLAQNADLREEAFRVIEPLTAHADSSGMDLLGTLQTYIDCNYNISLTARNLYIHRQSLLYRLGKIEELTGMSLHDHRHLFLLEIYTRIYSGY